MSTRPLPLSALSPAASPSPLGYTRATEAPSPTRSRTASFTESLLNSRPPLGALAATGEAFGRAPSLADLRRHSSSSVERRRGSFSRRKESSSNPGPPMGENATIQERVSDDFKEPMRQPGAVAVDQEEELASETNVEGSGSGEWNEEEEKPGAWAVTKTGLMAFWRYFTTPLGFFITIYMLNVVAWGGMLFLLLCNAAPAMCKPTCSDKNSPRLVWLEIDSQILNALFCVTGFGLIPWRFRDLYYLLQWRWFGKQRGYLKLQEINQGWYRPAPPASSLEDGQISPDAAETAAGRRAPPTKSWKLDYVIWLYVWNTFLQAVLSGFMWGMNRHKRPSWSTGLFVALACIVAGMAGGQVWWETRKVKQIEGEKEKKPVSDVKARPE